MRLSRLVATVMLLVGCEATDAKLDRVNQALLCQVGLSSNPSGSAPSGTVVMVTATGDCAGTPEYRFWVRDLSGTWNMTQDYGGNQFNWNTTGLAPGMYGLGVWIRQQGSGDEYEQYAAIDFVVTAAEGACSNPA